MSVDVAAMEGTVISEETVMAFMKQELGKIVTGFSVDDMNENTSFNNDLKLDSLDQVELMMVMEKQYGVSIDDQALERLMTIGDAVKEIVTAASAKQGSAS